MGKKKNIYSVEFKVDVINRYNSGDEGGVKMLSKKLGFRSNTMLRDWLKKYIRETWKYYNYYNNVRIQKRLGYLTPAEFKKNELIRINKDKE